MLVFEIIWLSTKPRITLLPNLLVFKLLRASPYFFNFTIYILEQYPDMLTCFAA